MADTALRIYPRPQLSDELFTELMSGVPDSKFYFKSSVMVPYSVGPQAFVLETNATDGTLIVTVNGKEQFLGSPVSPIRTVMNPLRVIANVGTVAELPNLDDHPDLRAGDLALVSEQTQIATGIASFVVGSTDVSGVGSSTRFAVETPTGSFIRPAGTSQWYRVSSVADPLAQLEMAYSGKSYTGPFEIRDLTPTAYSWNGNIWAPVPAYGGVLVVEDPTNPLGFHIKMDVPLTLVRGQNDIEVLHVESDLKVRLQVNSLSTAGWLRAAANSLYRNVFLPLTQEEAALKSQWSPRFIEHLLNYRALLPDLKIPHTHAVKMAVQGSVIKGGTDKGVRDFVAALGYNNPIVRNSTNKDFTKVSYKLVTRQDELNGVRFHLWFPSLGLVKWMAFALLAENIPESTKILDMNEDEIQLYVEGVAQRLEQHRFDGGGSGGVGPDFNSIVDSIPRMEPRFFVSRHVTHRVGFNFYTYPLNMTVQEPQGVRRMSGTQVLTGLQRLRRNDGVDMLGAFADPETVGFGWHTHPITSTRFAYGTPEQPQPRQLNTRSGIYRNVAPVDPTFTDVQLLGYVPPAPPPPPPPPTPVPAPTLLGMGGSIPSSGPVGTAVTIGGHNLQYNPVVTFNGVPATNTTFSPDGLFIHTVVPVGAPLGIGPMVVTTDGGSVSKNFTVTSPVTYQLNFTQQPPNPVYQNLPFTVTIELRSSLGALMTTAVGSCTLSAPAGFAFVAGTVVVQPFVNGVATFTNIQIASGTGPMSLRASSSVLPSTTDGFSTQVQAHSLTPALVPPTLAPNSSGVLDPFVVNLVDELGAVVTNSGYVGTITVTLGDQSGNTSGLTAVLSGTTTQPVVNGVATFNDLAISEPGYFTLTLTSTP